jgi:hypothetical protein
MIGKAKMATAEQIPTYWTKGKKSLVAVAVIALIAAFAWYIARCSFITSSRNKAFDAVQIGDTEASVIARFGLGPSVREEQGTLFARYASKPCMSPCFERLWFENRLQFDIEAWSVELDRSAHVVGKAHWVSP